MAQNNTQPFLPHPDVPFLDKYGHVTVPWYTYLVLNNQRSGGAIPANTSAQLQFVNNQLIVTQGSKVLGDLSFGTPKQSVIVLNPLTSPFEYTTTNNGFIIVQSGKFEFSRDSGTTWYQISLNGGVCLGLSGDMFRITWTESGIYNIPSIVWVGGSV